MANYREILRLHSLGISNKQVSAACHCSRTTVIDVLKRATEISLEWGSAKDLSDKEITDAKRVFLEPPDRSTESHWRAEIRAGGAGPRAIEANTNIKSHLS